MTSNSDPATTSPLHAGYSSSTALNINDLPNELLLKIFSYTSDSHWPYYYDDDISGVLMEVCTRWKILVHRDNLGYIEEYTITSTEEWAVTTFQASPQLRTVTVNTFISSATFEALFENCPNLTTLKIFYPNFHNFFQLPSLGLPCRSYDPMTDKRFLDGVARLSHLRVLRLMEYENPAHPVQLRLLADGCPQLCEIDLGYIRCLFQDLEYFINAKKHMLKHLSLMWTSVEKRCIVPLLTMCADTLEHLHLRRNDVREEECVEAFTALGQLHNLRELTFGTSGQKMSHVISVPFKSGGLSKLQQLSLYCDDDVGDETIIAISEECTLLRELSLRRCDGHTEAAFHLFHQLKQLEKLEISSCDCLGGRAIEYISMLPKLNTLSINYLKFKKAEPGVECFLNMSALRHLCISDSTCLSIPFSRFPGRLTNLRELQLLCCDVNQQELNRLSAQMPDLDVYQSECYSSEPFGGGRGGWYYVSEL